MSAPQAQAQVHPRISQLQAFLTSPWGAGSYGSNVAEMKTRGHIILLSSVACEIAMGKSHRHGSLAYRRRAALHRSVAHVARGKEARNACFQVERFPLERPVVRGFAIPPEIR